MSTICHRGTGGRVAKVYVLPYATEAWVSERLKFLISVQKSKNIKVSSHPRYPPQVLGFFMHLPKWTAVSSVTSL